MSSNWAPGLLAPDPDDIVKCVACGLCLPHCPTFRVTGKETASPRGRIAAMRAVDEGIAEMDATFTTMMDECLACRACEAACPSGVPFGRMIEAARAQLEPTRPAPAKGLKRAGLSFVLPRPRLVRGASTGLAILQALRLDRLVPPRLRASTPRVRLADVRTPLPEEVGEGPTAAVLTGCVMDGPFRPVNAATMQATADAGFRAVARSGCCGALAMHYGLPEVAKHLARERIAELADADVVVVNSAGCSGHMKAYGELLADDLEWAERAHRLGSRVRDFVELPLNPKGRSLSGPVAIHDACHHLHAQGIGPELRDIVQACGGTCVEVQNVGRCCGAAGLYSVTQPEMSGELRRQKAEEIIATGAPIVAVANPGCAIQIAQGLREAGSDIRVVHPAEMVT
jgi:glycolate oxidase iron-sulfur subunit